MQEPLVSIICTTYNHGPFIRQCLDGFMMQKTNFTFEVLIHDDASTDNTAEIIREYEDKYPDIIKPIYQTENQYSKGVKIGLTYLYPNAKGKYIAECEGDDYWTDPLKLQKQVVLLEKNINYSCSFHLCNIVNSFGEITHKNYPQRFNIKDSIISLENLIYESAMPQTLSIVFRSSVIDCLPQSCMITDITLYYFLLKKGNAICVAENMGVYRNHSAGEWSKLTYTQKIISTVKCRLDIYNADTSNLSALFVIMMFRSYPRSLIFKELLLTNKIIKIICKHMGFGKTIKILFNKIILNKFPSVAYLRNSIYS